MVDLTEQLSKILGGPVQHIETVSGSTFDSSIVAHTSQGRCFVKFGGNHQRLAAEYDGLVALSNLGQVRVPEPRGLESHDNQTFLITQYIKFHPPRRQSYVTLAELLVENHRQRGPGYGWHRDNFIGATAQQNTFNSDWRDFFLNYRLLPQFKLAESNGYAGRIQALGEHLITNFNSFAHAPEASLLHGDLWHGNCKFDTSGAPVIFDPAVYYGDRETDIAMMRLFGGYPREFFNAYHSLWPLPDGHQIRVKIYNLYHELNHLNLFGGSYLNAAISSMEDILSHLR